MKRIRKITRLIRDVTALLIALKALIGVVVAIADKCANWFCECLRIIERLLNFGTREFSCLPRKPFAAARYSCAS